MPPVSHRRLFELRICQIALVHPLAFRDHHPARGTSRLGSNQGTLASLEMSDVKSAREGCPPPVGGTLGSTTTTTATAAAITPPKITEVVAQYLQMRSRETDQRCVVQYSLAYYDPIEKITTTSWAKKRNGVILLYSFCFHRMSGVPTGATIRGLGITGETKISVWQLTR